MAAEIFRFGNFELDRSAYELRRGGTALHLQRIPFQLLSLLVERHGQLVTREEILERIWGKGVFVDSENSINTAVRKIRRTLNDVAGAPRFIITVPARGYRFAAPISPRPPTPSAGIYEMPSPLPFRDKPSIAVLPFTDMSSDHDQEYFSDGITDDLITALSRLPGVFVVARSSTFTYKGKAAKVQDIGRELGVAYVLEGSVRKSENELRITAQLVDTTSGNHLWAERFDRPLKDIFALQDEIVQKIVTTLKLQLTLEQQGWVSRKHTDNLEAYDYYLRGLLVAHNFTKEGNAQARLLWEKAVALDPEYAEAYAQLGRTYYFEWAYHWSTDPQTPKRAFELVRKALALDDTLPMAHSRLGQLYSLQQQHDQAIAEGERAVALDPNNADSHLFQASVLNNAGRPEEALGPLAQAMRLNPHYPPVYLEELGKAYSSIGRYAEAITALKEANKRIPSFGDVHLLLALSYLGLWLSQEGPANQTLEPALTAAQRGLALNDSHISHVVLGDVYLYQKQYEEALAEMERAVAVAPTEALSRAALATVLSYMGRANDAVEAAAQARRLWSRSTLRGPFNVAIADAVAGRFKEARAPLERSISRYPNKLDTHLMLAVVYSELGQAAEARAQAAEVLRLNPHFSLAVHKQRMPIKDPAALERHLAALRKAGLK
jgi:TolB-like protein/tetratricopeptide (TPR) repeat protein/DNA-binding winged helix-turn-helix (wHTH) protein